MANEIMRYETILVLNSALGEEAVSALAEKFKTLIAENSTVEKIEEWGKRRLAYPIEDETEGYYLLVQFESKPDFPAELTRVLKITEGVLRYLIVRNEVPVKPVVQEAEPVAEQPPEAEQPAAEAPAVEQAEAPVQEAAAPEQE